MTLRNTITSFIRIYTQKKDNYVVSLQPSSTFPILPDSDFTAKKVYAVVFQISSNKARGLDGFQVLSSKNHEVLGGLVAKFSLKLLNDEIFS